MLDLLRITYILMHGRIAQHTGSYKALRKRLLRRHFKDSVALWELAPMNNWNFNIIKSYTLKNTSNT